MHYRFLNPKFSMCNLIRTLRPCEQKFLLSIRNPGEHEKSRVNGERMCLRSRRDPPMGLAVDAARLTFGSRRRKRDPARELLVQTEPGLSKAKEPQVEFVKRTAMETRPGIGARGEKTRAFPRRRLECSRSRERNK